MFFFFFSSRRRHTRYIGDWSSDVCSSDLGDGGRGHGRDGRAARPGLRARRRAVPVDGGSPHGDRHGGGGMKRAVVTGCAGFIGSHLSERLVAEGWDVVGVDAFTPYYDRADKLDNLGALEGARRFSLVEGDLTELDLEPLMADAPVVFHLAAQPGVRLSFGEGFARYTADNLLATQRILEAAAAAGCPRVVWASSSSVYGDAAAYPCVEDETPTAPRSPYGVTKRACEDLAAIYRGQGLSTVGLRYFTVYGPRQRPDMAMRILC